MITKPKYKRVLFVSDVHAPYHDKKAVNALLTFAEWWKPDTVVIIGDLIDFYALSKFDKDPKRSLELQKEVSTANEVLGAICNTCKGADIHFLRGNHEYRLQRYLWTKAAELSGLWGLQLPNLLDINKLGIKYHADGRMNFRGMMFKHGNRVSKHAGYSAKAELEDAWVSGISGHTHRLASHYRTNSGGSHCWFEIGCLCLTNPEYMEGSDPNWQQGYAVGYYKEGSRRFHIDLIPVVSGKATYAGREFS